jgi:hypothetical protein|tara:strand:+ start:3647 stop:3862 length:216 start_codon:yes stop_codon:yes gene_type:complete
VGGVSVSHCHGRLGELFKLVGLGSNTGANRTTDASGHEREHSDRDLTSASICQFPDKVSSCNGFSTRLLGE